MVYRVPNVVQPVLLVRQSETFLGVTLSLTTETHVERMRSLAANTRIDNVAEAVLNILGSNFSVLFPKKFVDLLLFLGLRERPAWLHYIDRFN